MEEDLTDGLLGLCHPHIPKGCHLDGKHPDGSSQKLNAVLGGLDLLSVGCELLTEGEKDIAPLFFLIPAGASLVLSFSLRTQSRGWQSTSLKLIRQLTPWP